MTVQKPDSGVRFSESIERRPAAIESLIAALPSIRMRDSRSRNRQ